MFNRPLTLVLCAGELVVLVAMKEEPPLTATCMDKFLIISTIITPEKEALRPSEMVSSTSLRFLVIYYFADILIPLTPRNISIM